MKTARKIISALLISVILMSQIITINAVEEKISGKTIRQYQGLYNFKLFDNYYIGSELYECYLDKTKIIRIYYNPKKDAVVVDENTIRNLEMIYAVNEKGTGVFPEYKILTSFKQGRKAINDLYIHLNKFYVVKSLTKSAGSIIGSMGTKFLKDEDTVEKLKQFGEDFLDNLENDKDVQELVNDIALMAINKSYVECINQSDMGASLYNTYKGDKLKHYENAIKIISCYDFVWLTYKHAWGYSEKTTVKEMPKNIVDSAKKVFMDWLLPNLLNSALETYIPQESFLGIMMEYGNHLEKEKKQKELAKFIKDTEITSADIAAIVDVAFLSYNGKLTSKQKNLITKISYYNQFQFLEFYNGITSERLKLLEDLASSGYRSVNQVFSQLPYYSPSSFAKQSVQVMTDAGLLNKNTVYPYKKQLTREQFCELTYALYDMVTDDYVSFSDMFIDTDDVSVLRLNAMGVINGKEINKFLPNDKMNREEVAVAINNLLFKLGIDTTKDKTPVYFKDSNSVSVWAKTAVTNVLRFDIMDTVTSVDFKPKDPITLEQLIVILHKLHKFILDPQAINDGKIEGKITNVSSENGKKYITIDVVEWVYPSEIIKRKEIQQDILRKQGKDILDGYLKEEYQYYIYDEDSKLIKVPVSDKIEIYSTEYDLDSGDYKKVVTSDLSRIDKSEVYEITIKNHVITQMLKYYRP